VTLRERLEWIVRMALLLFILSSVAFLSALTAMRFAIQGREVTMPNVVGSGAKQAEQVLHSRSLGMKVEDRVYSKLAVDAVVRQSPPPSTRVKTGQDAHVVLSLGPPSVSIPAVQDLSMRAAQVELLRSGMQLGEVSSVYLPDTQPDTVLQQDPAQGTTNVQSPHVDLLVSLGPRPAAFVMPDLLGGTVAEAESKLATAELRVTKVTPVPTTQATVGTVINQVPSRGQRVDAKATVELEIAQ
jgi:eukaryotic-like serine/threonine-protein kinase